MDEKLLYVYEVTKADLDHQVVDKLIGILDELKLGGTQFRSSLTIICNVYNDTADELYAIPKFRKWMRKVVKLRPLLFYFLSLEMDYAHILGCLGDVSTVTTGKPLSIHEMEKQGIAPAKSVSLILLEEEYYEWMKADIQKFCKQIDDPIANDELISFLEYHHEEKRKR
jgi:hypothetical protein